MQTSVFTRAVPVQSTRAGTVVMGFADSTIMFPRVDGGTPTTRRLGGRSTQMNIRPDGGVEMIKADAANGDLTEFFGQMPAMLPGGSVAVGKKWTREMPVPLRGDAHGTGWVKTTFALDSISRNGDIAFISVRGALTHARGKDEDEADDATGTISGLLQLNRRLGWITDSRVTIVLQSIVRNAASQLKDAKSNAMHVRTKIVQHVRAVSK
jgi:hypothetical protein